MLRLSYAIILSAILIGLSIISDGFGDINCTFQTWLGSFILPLWSLASVSLWYDVGRLLLTKTFNFDTNNSTLSNDIRSFGFILWMSFVFTYIVWIHISLFAVPLLLVIPILGISFKEHMIQDWSIKPEFTREQILTLVFWASTSYLVYWFLSIAWILIRVWTVDVIEDGFIYYIQ